MRIHAIFSYSSARPYWAASEYFIDGRKQRVIDMLLCTRAATLRWLTLDKNKELRIEIHTEEPGIEIRQLHSGKWVHGKAGIIMSNVSDVLTSLLHRKYIDKTFWVRAFQDGNLLELRDGHKTS